MGALRGHRTSFRWGPILVLGAILLSGGGAGAHLLSNHTSAAAEVITTADTSALGALGGGVESDQLLYMRQVISAEGVSVDRTLGDVVVEYWYQPATGAVRMTRSAKGSKYVRVIASDGLRYVSFDTATMSGSDLSLEAYRDYIEATGKDPEQYVGNPVARVAKGVADRLAMGGLAEERRVTAGDSTLIHYRIQGEGSDNPWGSLVVDAATGLPCEEHIGDADAGEAATITWEYEVLVSPDSAMYSALFSPEVPSGVDILTDSGLSERDPWVDTLRSSIEEAAKELDFKVFSLGTSYGGYPLTEIRLWNSRLFLYYRYAPSSPEAQASGWEGFLVTEFATADNDEHIAALQAEYPVIGTASRGPSNYEIRRGAGENRSLIMTERDGTTLMVGMFVQPDPSALADAAAALKEVVR